MRNRILEGLNGIAFAIAVLGINFVTFYAKPIPVLVIILGTVGLAIFYIVVATKKEREKSYSFKEPSDDFYKHFSKWYKQNGTLSLYRNDLDWLENLESNNVVYELNQKAEKGHLNLYLRECNGKIAIDLKGKGALIFQVKAGQITKHRMSLLEHDGIKKIIIRNKEMQDDKIAFIETSHVSDPYLISLVEDLLSNCKR